MTTCYCKNANGLNAAIGGECDSAAPCKDPVNGEVVQCCGAGSTCGSDGFCFFTGATTSNITGYYMGGCTDPSFTDPACPNHCTDFTTQDAVYVPSQRKWFCCHQNAGPELNCNDPGNESFSAPAPFQLAFSVTSSASTPSSTSTATAAGAVQSSTSASVSSQPQGSPSGPSTVIIALAAVLAGLGLALITGLGVFLVRRRRKASAKANGGPPSYHVSPPLYPPVAQAQGPAPYAHYFPPQEKPVWSDLPQKPLRSELGGPGAMGVTELGATRDGAPAHMVTELDARNSRAPEWI